MRFSLAVCAAGLHCAAALAFGTKQGVLVPLRDAAVLESAGQSGSGASDGLVVGLAAGYALFTVRRFVGSLRHSGFNGTIVMGVFAGVGADVRAFAAAHRVVLADVPADEVTRSKQLLSWRFGWYSRVLARHCAWPGCSALLTDVRDVFFQADPLARLSQREGLHGTSAAGKDALAVFLEYFNARTGNVAIGDDYFNSGWIRDCWGDAGLARLAKKPIACAGVLAGSRTALQRYLTVWQKEQQLHGGRCNDQGVHNWLLHTGRLDPVIAHRQGAGLVNNLGLLKGRAPLTRDAVGFVLDANGMRSAAVHQWDRFSHDLRPFVDKLSCGLIAGVPSTSEDCSDWTQAVG